jgi:hypothetical protein
MEYIRILILCGSIFSLYLLFILIQSTLQNKTYGIWFKRMIAIGAFLLVSMFFANELGGESGFIMAKIFIYYIDACLLFIVGVNIHNLYIRIKTRRIISE